MSSYWSGVRWAHYGSRSCPICALRSGNMRMLTHPCPHKPKRNIKWQSAIEFYQQDLPQFHLVRTQHKLMNTIHLSFDPSRISTIFKSVC